MAALDLTDDLKITAETPASIKARLLADTNAGVDPNDPAYADTLPGSFWDDLNGAGVLEYDRIYDRMNELVAAAIPGLSYGAFLDAWAVSLELGRKDAALAGGAVTFTGPNGTIIPAGAQISTAQTSTDADPVEFQTTEGGTISGGTLTVNATARIAGSEGNVPANTVTLIDTPLPDGVAVTNPAKMTGGADVETDPKLQSRILRKLSGAGGGGNADDYINWGLNYPGVGFVTVQPNTPDFGHVLMVITDENNDPMPTAAIDGLQALIDPSDSAAQGAGLAPVGATVVVTTPATTAVTIVAEITVASGYSLDGAGGTYAVRDDIDASLSRYVDRLPAGGDAVYNKVVAAIIDVLGVEDVTTTGLDAMTINGTAGTLAIASDHVASLTTPVTLTVAA